MTEKIIKAEPGGWMQVAGIYSYRESVPDLVSEGWEALELSKGQEQTLSATSDLSYHADRPNFDARAETVDGV